MKKLFSLWCILFISITMFAQYRSEQEAIQIAQEFFKPTAKEACLAVVPQQKVQAKLAKMANSTKRAAAVQNSSFYIINDEANNRFVIVSADERMYEILGYSDNGCFDAGKAPEALLELMTEFSNQYNFLLQNGNQILKKEGPAKVEPIEPMIKTKWNQGSPYNNECPFDKTFEPLGINIRSATGCAATAMAQIMNYYKYPEHGDGYISYVTDDGIEQEMNLSSVIFDWNNMSNEYNSESNDVQKQAVAELMHACGVAIRMQYSFFGSSARSVDVSYALSHYFKYNSNIQSYLRNYFSSEEWNSIILNNLRHNMPILYSGQTKTYDDNGNVQKDDDGEYITNGHGFVIDGCDENLLYHINFGYSGEYDGYYSLTALTLKENTTYELNQEMVCNISPNETGTKEDVFINTSLLMFESLQSSWYSLELKKKIGESVIFGYNPVNYCNSTNSYNQPFVGEFGIGLFDLDYNFITYLKKNSISSYNKMYAGYGYSSKTENVYLFYSDFKNGNQYIIAPYAKTSDAEKPTVMRTRLLDAYLATVANDSVTLTWYSEPASIITKDVESQVGEKVKMQIAFDNKNTSYKGFQFEMTLPEGVSIAKDTEGVYVAELSNRCIGENVEFYISNPKENVYKFSVLNTEISASEGNLIDVTIATSANVKEGSYPASINNIYFTKPNGKMMDLENSKFNIKVIQSSEIIISGDANNDKIVDVADIVYIVNHIMGNPAPDFNFKNADLDNDGVIDVADITLVVNIIMQANGSQAPAYANGVLTGLNLADLGDGKAALNVPTSSQYVASQFDVIVPSGSSITDISLNADIINTHEVRYNQIGSNRYRVVVYSSNNNAFENNSGDLLTIKTNSNSNKVSVENMVCVTSSGVKYGYTNTKSNTTGIRSITTANNNHAIYSIDGREVNQKNLSKGMYIINGKKLVVK